MNANDADAKMLDYFRSNGNRATDKRASQVLTNQIHSKFGDFFSGVGCFEGTFSLHVKEGSQSYQVPHRRLAYALQDPLKWS